MSEQANDHPIAGGNTSEKTPHTGNLDGELRETPLKNYSTTLADAVDAGLIPSNTDDIHDHLEENFAEAPFTEDEIAMIREKRAKNETTDTTWWSKRKIGALAGLGTLAGVVLAGVVLKGTGNKEESTVPSVNPTTGQSFKPSQSPTPSDPTVLTPPNPVVEAEKKRTMSGETVIALEAVEFAELPRETQLRGFLHILQHSLDKSTHPYVILDDNGKYKGDITSYNPFDIASIDNTPQQIVPQNLYMEATALGARVEQGKSSSPMDKRLAEITLGSAYYFTEKNKEVTLSYKLRLDEIKDESNTEDLHLANRKEEVIKADQLDTCPVSVSGETTLPCRDIQTKIIQKNGTEAAPYWTRYVFVTDKDSGKGIWQILARDANKQSLDNLRKAQ